MRDTPRAGVGLTPRGPPPPPPVDPPPTPPIPLARAGQGRDLRAGPQKGGRGGGATLVTQGACGWAQSASLSLKRRVLPLRSRGRCLPLPYAPPLPPPPPPPCPTSPVPGRCAAARISTSSSRRWVSWCGGRAGSARSRCEVALTQRGWPGEVQAGGSLWGDKSLCFLCVPRSHRRVSSGTNQFN